MKLLVLLSVFFFSSTSAAAKGELTNVELQSAVAAEKSGPTTYATEWGNISDWNTAMVTGMGKLFQVRVSQTVHKLKPAHTVTDHDCNLFCVCVSQELSTHTHTHTVHTHRKHTL